MFVFFGVDDQLLEPFKSTLPQVSTDNLPAKEKLHFCCHNSHAQHDFVLIAPSLAPLLRGMMPCQPFSLLHKTFQKMFQVLVTLTNPRYESRLPLVK